MDKSVAPRKYELTPIDEAVRNFEQAVEVPSMIGSLIWVRIDIPRSVYGNVVAMLNRPPAVSLNIFTRSGRLYGGRLITATARAGFLLLPLVENRQSLFVLASTNWQHELANLEVASAVISTDRGWVTKCYQSPVGLRFHRLDFQRQDLGSNTLNRTRL
jgi:hypothetical protein